MLRPGTHYRLGRARVVRSSGATGPGMMDGAATSEIGQRGPVIWPIPREEAALRSRHRGARRLRHLPRRWGAKMPLRGGALVLESSNLGGGRRAQGAQGDRR